MGERIPCGSGMYFPFPPPPSPIRPSSSSSDRDRYLAELLAERQKLVPFLQVLPQSTKLLTQEIRRMSVGGGGGGFNHEPAADTPPPYFRPMDLEGWAIEVQQDKPNPQRMMAWPAPVVKRVIRLDVPVDKFPNYNFVGRILGPRGNSLKRVEAMTECRVYIRGCGSVKDSIKEEKLKEKPGYEHLKEPLHVLVEAEFPEDIINARLDHAVAILENLLKPVVYVVIVCVCVCVCVLLHNK
ncbi:KH domain-containing protein isoform C [Glycine soja]|uniref:KH domain-containing protein isoform C n=1 Tax=Glycine soja TaxID=3848 RepID=A0A445HR93_GLYSO|nr:KH domain-containing protein isoform C [Glycine soja]